MRFFCQITIGDSVEKLALEADRNASVASVRKQIVVGANAAAGSQLFTPPVLRLLFKGKQVLLISHSNSNA
jgi:hypothetical protein